MQLPNYRSEESSNSGEDLPFILLMITKRGEEHIFTGPYTRCKRVLDHIKEVFSSAKSSNSYYAVVNIARLFQDELFQSEVSYKNEIHIPIHDYLPELRLICKLEFDRNAIANSHEEDDDQIDFDNFWK